MFQCLHYAHLGITVPCMADRSPREALATEVRRAASIVGFSDAELARRSLIPRETLRRKLAGAHDFTLGELSQIAAATGGDLVAWVDTYAKAKAAA